MNILFPIERVSPYPWGVVKDIYRWFKAFLQRGLRGYADTDVWSLDVYLATWLPSAIRQLKNGTGCPGKLTQDEWNTLLDFMAETFEVANELSISGMDRATLRKKTQRFKKGMDVFKTHFLNLWD